MTKAEYIAKYQEALLWLGMRGLTLDADERPRGPFGSAAYAMTLPERIQAMVDQMWKDAQPEAELLQSRPMNGLLSKKQATQ